MEASGEQAPAASEQQAEAAAPAEGTPQGAQATSSASEVKEDATEIFHESSKQKSIDITETHFKYVKPRSAFGKQTQFLEDRARVHCGLRANRERYFPMFQQMSIISKQLDTMPPLRCLDTNTSRAEYRNFTTLHLEGGWPKDVNLRDPESVEKARRKLQKEESFVDTMPILTREAEYLVKHNNAMGLCDPLNSKLYVPKRETKPYANVVSVYRCPTMLKRPVSRISFCPNDPARMVCAYCPYEFDPTFREHSCEAFFWEVENPTRPEGLVRAAAQIVDVRYHPFQTNLICGALFTGQVCTWDTRVGPNPQAISSFEVSHEDVCTHAIWTTADKESENQEFFSSGLDGQIIWWDSRNLEERLDAARTDHEKENSAPPISALEYDASSPSKFLVGTQFGQVLSFVKGEEKNSVACLYKAHKGPTTAIQRNPLYPEYFVSCGGYDLRIFAEECKESGIMWTSPSDTLYSCGQWLKGRPCSLVASRIDGSLEFWDLLILGSSSILTTKVCEESLTTVCSAENGEHIAAGTVTGEIRVVQLCPFMTTIDDGEKEALGASFAREARRENSLVHKYRHAHAKKKSVEEPEEEEDEDEEEPVKEGTMKKKPDPYSNPDIVTDKEFFDMLADEKKKQGVNAFPDKKEQAEEHARALIEGRMDDKKKALAKAHKKSDTELGAKEILQINENALKKADAIIEGDEKQEEEEDEEEEEEMEGEEKGEEGVEAEEADEETGAPQQEPEPDNQD